MELVQHLPARQEGQGGIWGSRFVGSPVNGCVLFYAALMCIAMQCVWKQKVQRYPKRWTGASLLLVFTAACFFL